MDFRSFEVVQKIQKSLYCLPDFILIKFLSIFRIHHFKPDLWKPLQKNPIGLMAEANSVPIAGSFMSMKWNTVVQSAIR
jgi:hypothetical protein